MKEKELKSRGVAEEIAKKILSIPMDESGWLPTERLERTTEIIMNAMQMAVRDSVGGETPKPDHLEGTPPDDGHGHDCRVCGEKINNFAGNPAEWGLQTFQQKFYHLVCIDKNLEKVSGEAKTPDAVEVNILNIPLGVIFTVGGHRVVGMADNKGRNFGVFNADEPFDKHFPKAELSGVSVPTPSGGEIEIAATEANPDPNIGHERMWWISGAKWAIKKLRGLAPEQKKEE